MANIRQTRMRDQVSIDIREQEEDLVNSIREKMESVSYLHCICKVKSSLSQAYSKAYIPDKVSIGPYHFNANENLKSMEDKKWRYVHTLLNRKPNLEASIDDCVTALKEVEHRARACYEDGIGSYSSNEFLQMMFVDGCFIIELLLKYSIRSLRTRNDPIFSTPGLLFDLRCNLILLENQIPLFILQRLFQVVPMPKHCTFSFPELAFRFFKNMIPGDPKINREKFNQEAHHLLDIICHCLLPAFPRVMTSRLSKLEYQALRSATELKGSGIQVRIARTDNLLDIKFSKGFLQIPPIVVHQYTESLFRNLIALEQCSSDSMQHITSYAIFMKGILTSEKDVKLLKQKEILVNYDANQREVDKLFDEICKEVDLKEFYYDGLCEEMIEYSKGISWHKKLKYRRKKQRNNPQFRTVLLIAMLVLLITVVGTLFSVLSFAHRRH